jgi:hypothetical protein
MYRLVFGALIIGRVVTWLLSNSRHANAGQ